MGHRTAALAGINGGFFCHGSDDICHNNTQCPLRNKALALLKINGELISTNCKQARTSFGITKQGNRVYPVIQRIPAKGQGRTWPAVQEAIGAGPTLVWNKAKRVTQEGFPWVSSPHPRTAVVMTSDNHLLLVTVDGTPQAAGMNLHTLARFLIEELHAAYAMNFDGGGSTTMYVAGQAGDGAAILILEIKTYQTWGQAEVRVWI